MNAETALTKSRPRPVLTWLFNPFHYVAGGQALAIGAGILAVSALVAIPARVHFDGVLDFHAGLVTPWWVYVAEGPISWLCAALFLLIAGKLLSKSRVRTVDVLGTQAMARFPYLLFALWYLPPVIRDANTRVAETLLKSVSNPGANPFAGLPAADLVIFSITAVLAIVMLVWLVALMYRAYTVSCNLKGLRAVAGFIPALILAEILSKVLIMVLFTAAGVT